MELTPTERRLLLDNSVERVINTSLRLAGAIAANSKAPEALREDAFVNTEDWHALKSLAVKLWDVARNEAFKENQPKA